MKKILIITCTLLLVFNVFVYAENGGEIEKIKNLLETKTIKNYETILIPLKGDPKNFNITEEDDLRTIEFGEGVQGYSINKQKIKEAAEQKATMVEPYLERKDKWYFPIIVSDKEVAMAEIVKEGNEYKVLCVASGSIFDNFVREQKNVKMSDAKYVTEGIIINGFVVNKDNKETFIDLDMPESGNKIQTVNSTGKSVVELFNERFEKVSTEGDKTFGGYGSTDNKMYVVLLIMIIAVSTLFVIVKKKRA